MIALAYRNTKTTLPNWVPIHEEQSRGIAYETDTHFVHFYGRGEGLWVVSSGLTATEGKSGTLRDWVVRAFGAEEIVEMSHLPGTAIKAVWRPGLYYDNQILEALDSSGYDLRLAEQALLMLLQRLDEILHFVEPTVVSLSAYSHKARELLILACTEVENNWTTFLRAAGLTPPTRGFTTSDYVRLLEPLRLPEYYISFPRYAALADITPFGAWDATQPTQSLVWYNAYNKTKHDRSMNFSYATLENCLNAVAANLVLFTVRFGPYPLFQGAGPLPSFLNQLFSMELKGCDPSTFYAPKVKLTDNHRSDFVCFESRKLTESWTSQALTV